LIIDLSQGSSSRKINNKRFKIFSTKTFKIDSKVLNSCEFPIISSNTKAKKIPQNLLKSWDVTDYHP
jgi:hypothetical protein